MGIESLTLEGGTIDDLDIYFTLPGYDVELKVLLHMLGMYTCFIFCFLQPHGKDIPVTIHNLDEYLKVRL